MSVFELHRRALERYKTFIRSFVDVKDPKIGDFLRRKIEEEKWLWPEPFLQVSSGYAYDGNVDELERGGLLHGATAQAFRNSRGEPFRLYRHQVEAIEKARRKESFILTSGTGSGKSYSYFIPIFDQVARNPGVKGPVAIVVYPMNALANSQLKALDTLKANYEKKHGSGSFPLTYALYTSSTSEEERDELRKRPPHLLLTNYVMLEYLMVRPDDRPLVSPPPGELPFFLVFDELHTYRGRQGADVAVLVRRLKARFPEGRPVVHIGTSATLVADKKTDRKERREVVARFAGDFFGRDFSEGEVIEEIIAPFTEGGTPTPEELRNALQSPFPSKDDLPGWRRHPVARFLEWELGLEEEEAGHYRRRAPKTIREAALLLAERSGLPYEGVRGRLEEAINTLSGLKDEGGRPAFAFKLHQFISQTRPLYATLDYADLEGPDEGLSTELLLREEKPYFPLRFCRNCGQEYFMARLSAEDGGRLVPVLEEFSLSENTEGEQEVLYLARARDGMDLAYPDGWYEENDREGGKLKSSRRKRAPNIPGIAEKEPVARAYVTPSGRISAASSTKELSIPVFVQKKPFSICVSCGEYYDGVISEYRKLTYLGSEGRTSSTTVLATGSLDEAERILGEGRSKLLSFTDNRQDASLQAGHFNDFVQTVLVRSALYQAVQKSGYLSVSDLADRVLEELNLSVGDYAQNPDAEDPSARGKFEDALRSVLKVRLYQDLRHEWRFTQPNLEDLRLIEVDYFDPKDRDKVQRRLLEDFRKTFPHLGHLPDDRILDPTNRAGAVYVLLDRLRKRLGIISKELSRDGFKKIREKSERELKDVWALLEDDLLPRRGLLVFEVRRKENEVRKKVNEEDLSEPVLLSERSKLGRDLMAMGLQLSDFEEFVKLLVRFDLLREDEDGYRIPESTLFWKPGSAAPRNRFFAELYRSDTAVLKGLEAREHTAQVSGEERIERERRFRFTEEDIRSLRRPRRLPLLVASPTLELGVDIADLDMVHLRNVPPTPANYAQRSGRAGRQGQPGLILTFASAFQHHDRYFFGRQQEMVSGAVRAPTLELSNEALLRSHIQAEWLTQTGLRLYDSIKLSLEVPDDTNEIPGSELALTEDVKKQIALSEAAKAELISKLKRVFARDWERLKEDGFDEERLRGVVEEAPVSFDRTFDRWRNLYKAAAREVLEANKLLINRRQEKEDRDRAERRMKEAQRQMDLLEQENVSREEGDFYPYRYLANEGFLPGYGFPTLPVSVWIPRKRAGEEKGEYIQRPRHLAIGEMSPGSFLYHEGAKWVSYRFLSTPGGLRERTSERYFCRSCGAIVETDRNTCPYCKSELSPEKREILRLLEFTNVAARKSSRITVNEEERIKVFQNIWSSFYIPEGQARRVRRASLALSEDGELPLTYLPSTELYYINQGIYRKPGQEGGFLIDLETGRFLKEKEVKEAAKPERYDFYVKVVRNALSIRPNGIVNTGSLEELYSFAYALKRGIEAAFQLEETELGLEVLGQDEHLHLLYIEESEGGLGVLRRLVEEPALVAGVARKALEVLHFDGEEDTKPECERACYECLLSYGNHKKAPHLNRHKARKVLEKLTKASGFFVFNPDVEGEEERFRELLERCQSGLERSFLEFLRTNHLPLPDAAQRRISEASTIADFFYKPNIAVYIDGPVHQKEQQRKIDEHQRRKLMERGYRVVVFGEDTDAWLEIFRAKLADALTNAQYV